MTTGYRPLTTWKIMIITADDRERSSGLIELLVYKGIEVAVRHLSCCDYIINNEIAIERKTGKDFLVSIVDGRLFRQAKAMKNGLSRPVFLIEGNPFKVDMGFTPGSIRGVILSLQVIWYIPVLFSKSKEDTCRIFRMLGDQEQVQTSLLSLRHGYRPKKLITKQLYILQGLPNVGPKTAKRMLEHFGTVRRVMQADIESLSAIDGIGERTAKTICGVLDAHGRIVS
jgi:DNA excision repair protein ERCC-4